MNHTQGKWKSRLGFNGIEIISDSGFIIATVSVTHRKKEINDANAKLIESAPDLLESLIKLIELKKSGLDKNFHSAFESAKAAIKKATE